MLVVNCQRRLGYNDDRLSNAIYFLIDVNSKKNDPENNFAH